jgi:hypothetical protein
MATPRVFISSTCYDLKHIRESLKFFVSNIGYEPVLSEEGDVYYNTNSHTHEACLDEVSTCQIFILIIGGRFGGKYKELDKSITNMEYIQAIKQTIPIFTLVDSGVNSDYFTYIKNKHNLDIVNQISYPNIDNIKIFDFIENVKKQKTNNAFGEFSNFSDIENYLKKQWSGMMYSFLTENKQSKDIKSIETLLNSMKVTNEKTEKLVESILQTTDKENANTTINNVDNLINGNLFLTNIFKAYGNEIFLLDDLKKNLKDNIKWYDFILSFNGFRLETLKGTDRNVDTKLYIVMYDENIIAISAYMKNEKNGDVILPKDSSELQKHYEGLRSLTSEHLEEIFSKVKNNTDFAK